MFDEFAKREISKYATLYRICWQIGFIFISFLGLFIPPILSE